MTLPLEITADFSAQNARALAQASRWAYVMKPDIEGVLSDSQAIFFDAGNAYVLAFRGTTDIKDWLTDCKFLLRPALDFEGKIHDGFYDAMMDIQKDVGVLVTGAMMTQPKPLFITGHSLGGALANLFANFLAGHNVNVQAVYTFGQPRVGDRKYAASYNSKLGSRTYRLAYENDLVPHVPLPGLLLRYLQNKNEVMVCDHYQGIPHLQFNRPIEQKLFWDGVMLVRAWRLLGKCQGNPILLPLALIAEVKANHSIENYIAKLNSISTDTATPLEMEAISQPA
jgi:hypothetical protein